jgi:hypothetical protein
MRGLALFVLFVGAGCDAVVPTNGDAAALPDGAIGGGDGGGTIPDAPPGTARLTVSKIGNGAGSITSTVVGIDCGIDCFEDYPIGALIELVPSSTVGSSFLGWTGACSGTGPCSVRLNSSADVTATFDCAPGSTTIPYSGQSQLMTLPSCVSSIDVDVRGASGGMGRYSTSFYGNPGLGGRVQATIAVAPGDQFLVTVGGAGANGGVGGYNGGGSPGSQTPGPQVGGGGGGASDIRRNGTTLADRIVVAGGGGGGGICSTYYGYDGGFGGGMTGGDAIYSCGGSVPTGGTQYSGGFGGYYSCTAPNGNFGAGGSGCSPGGSGGGGGGYYGGGGGASSGGGGGSSFVTSSASSVIHTEGVQTGHGSVTISW